MVQRLYLTAELNNVTGLKPQDSTSQPFEYTFILECTKCHERYNKPITINLYEQYEIEGSRGTASFVGHCSFCKSKSNINIKLPKGFKGYSLDDNGERVEMLEMDARGVQLVKFIPDGPFYCKSGVSNTEFKEFLLSEDEWYDYDEVAAEETSVTETKWEIV